MLVILDFYFSMSCSCNSSLALASVVWGKWEHTVTWDKKNCLSMQCPCLAFVLFLQTFIETVARVMAISVFKLGKPTCVASCCRVGPGLGGPELGEASFCVGVVLRPFCFVSSAAPLHPPCIPLVSLSLEWGAGCACKGVLAGECLQRNCFVVGPWGPHW